MRKNQAKKIACDLLAGLLKDALNNGWPFEDRPFWDSRDEKRISDSLKDLYRELCRRGTEVY